MALKTLCKIDFYYLVESNIVQLSLDEVGREGERRGSATMDPFPRVVYSCPQIFVSRGVYLFGVPVPWLLRFGELSMLSPV